jgi:multicomponent K+:H+ antiporter subunit D
LLLASLVLLIAFSRAGSTVFWRHQAEGKPAALPLADAAPLTFLLLLCVAMVVLAAPMMDIAASTATQLANAQGYIDAVLGVAEVMP